MHLITWLRRVGTAGVGLLALGLPVVGWQVAAAPSLGPAPAGPPGPSAPAPPARLVLLGRIHRQRRPRPRPVGLPGARPRARHQPRARRLRSPRGLARRHD